MDLYIWLILLVVFLIAEAVCAVHLVSIWFAAGALVAMVVGLLQGPAWLQIVLFFLVSVGLLALLFPLTRKYLNPRITKTNIDSVIGSEGYVTADIDNLRACGQVKLGGMEWSARSADGSAIPVGTLVAVERIEGVKVFVSPVNVTVGCEQS